MIRSLVIRDLALIESAQIDFSSGFSVWTGETGAGKSLLLSAIGLILGARADAAQVRSGTAEAIVSGIFDLDRPDIRELVESHFDLPLADEDLILTRRIKANSGRSSASVNGLPVSVRTLQKLGRLLVDYVGQHETRSLAESETQTRILDTFGNVGPTLEAYQNARQTYESARLKRTQEIQTINAIRREKQLLEFEIAELEQLAPLVGEPAELMQEARSLARADEIQRLTADAFQKIYGRDDAMHDNLSKIVKRLQPIGALSIDLKSVVESLQLANTQLAESGRLLQSIYEQTEANPKRIDWIENRLSEYRRLATRFAVRECDLENQFHEHQARLSELQQTELAVLDYSCLESLWHECSVKASQVMQQRESAIGKLNSELPAVLSRLGLDSAKFDVRVTGHSWHSDISELPPCPVEPAPVQMLFQPNSGEEPRPIEQIASGGELSRMLLAFLVCLSDSDRMPTVIFDEIDTGVGGRMGSAIGEVLLALSKSHQVLCITHLPQIAAFADHHFLVCKTQKNRRTNSSITPLTTRKERVAELAAMLRGSRADNSTLREAASMLDHGQMGQVVNRTRSRQRNSAAVKTKV
jgi:DNA repair protein RecN (Recombination protein N)